MKAITIKQPWALLVAVGVKTVENRTTNVFGSYRGPLAIHSSRQIDRQALASARVRAALRDLGYTPGLLPALPLGAVLAVSELLDVHHDSVHTPVVVDDELRVTDPCSPWADRGAWHGVLTDAPRPLPVPVPWTGRLSLWELPDAVVDALEVAR